MKRTLVFDNETGKPLNIPTRLNCKVVKRTPTPTDNAQWNEILLALLCVFLVSVAIALKVSS